MADFFVGRRITGIDNLQFLICDLGLAQIENPFIPLAKAPRPQSNTRNIFFICLSLNCLCELCEKHCFHQLQIGNRKPQIYDLQSQMVSLTVIILTFCARLFYKYDMQQTDEIKNSLKREFALYSNAMAFYKNALKEYERKHGVSTQSFLKKFESGQLNDEPDFFDWYAFAKLLDRWRKAQAAIRSAIQ